MSIEDYHNLAYMGDDDDNADYEASIKQSERKLKMAKLWEPQTIEVYQSWVEACKNVSEKLNTWETDFVDSIENQLASRNLTERQAEILERIYANKT